MPQAIYAHQRWTPEEVAHLREHYATRSVADLAHELGRTHNAVYAMAEHIGVRKIVRACDHIEQLRDLHSAGLADTQIAQALGVSVSALRRWRVALGLSSNTTPQKAGAMAGPSLRARAQVYDEPNWGAYLAVCRRLAADARFRGCVSQTQADVCLALFDAPAARTIRQLAELTHRSQRSIAMALRDLLMVEIVERVLRSRVRGGREWVYSLRRGVRP